MQIEPCVTTHVLLLISLDWVSGALGLLATGQFDLPPLTVQNLTSVPRGSTTVRSRRAV